MKVLGITHDEDISAEVVSEQRGGAVYVVVVLDVEERQDRC